MSDEIFPKSAIVKVSFEVAIPVDATQDQILEWINDASGYGGGISMDNPLVKHSVEAIQEPILEDTRLYLHQVKEVSAKGTLIHSYKVNTPYTGPDYIDQLVSGDDDDDDNDDENVYKQS